MVRSMTGYGRSNFEVEGVGFEVEVRTVNHRHLDARIKLPRQLSDREPDVRGRIQGALDRGKVDLTVLLAPGASPVPELNLDLDLAGQYAEAARQLAEHDGLGGVLEVSTLLALPGVARLKEHELSKEALTEALEGAIDCALAGVCEMRTREGEALEREIRSRLDKILGGVAFIEGRSGVVVEAAREKLRRRSDQLGLETGVIDEGRLHQEIVIAADRLDITEETVRMHSHVEQFRGILAEAGPGVTVGRRLEFLLQEMGRETNTMGSKANDAELAHQVVELKSELERIREQVLNLE